MTGWCPEKEGPICKNEYTWFSMEEKAKKICHNQKAKEKPIINKKKIMIPFIWKWTSYFQLHLNELSWEKISCDFLLYQM